MRLSDELVDLRVRGEVDDDVDLRILDASDSAAESRVMACEILQKRWKCIGPGVLALVDAEDRCPSRSRRSARFVPI